MPLWLCSGWVLTAVMCMATGKYLPSTARILLFHGKSTLCWRSFEIVQKYFCWTSRGGVFQSCTLMCSFDIISLVLMKLDSCLLCPMCLNEFFCIIRACPHHFPSHPYPFSLRIPKYVLMTLKWPGFPQAFPRKNQKGPIGWFEGGVPISDQNNKTQSVICRIAHPWPHPF